MEFTASTRIATHTAQHRHKPLLLQHVAARVRYFYSTVQSLCLDYGLLLELHTLTQAACFYVIDNEAVFHSTVSAMAHDISPPMPPSSIVTVNCYSNKQIVTYADT